MTHFNATRKNKNASHSRKYVSILKKIRKEYLTEEKILKDKAIDDAQLYLDFADEIIVILGKDQRVLKINKKGCEILGYPENEIIGKKYFDTFIPVRFRNEMKEFFNDLIAGKKILRRYFENPVLTRKGERLIAWRNAILKDSKGNIIGTISEGRDITDERIREQRYIDSERRFRLLFENAPAGFIMCNRKGKILDVNQYFLSLTGFEKQDLTQKNLKTLVFPQDKRIFSDMFDALNKTYDLNMTEFRLMKKNGSVVCVHCMARATGEQKKMVQLIVYDISQRKMDETFLKSQEKLSGILNSSNSSSEIALRVVPIIRKTFGFEKVAIYFKEKMKKEIKKPMPRHVLDYFENKKNKGKFTDYGSFISSIRINGKVKFFVCIPLKINQNLMATLYCQDRVQGKFNPETIKFLENMAGTISVGLQRCAYFEKLESTLGNFNKFLNSAKDLVFIKDSSSKYVFVNDKFAKLFKKRPQDIIGKTDFYIMDPADAKACQKNDKRVLHENKLTVIEEIVGGKAYESRKFPVKLENGEIGIGAFARDITEEKENRQKIENLMWLYSMLYQTNQLIVRAKDIEHLYRNICEIACKEGRFVLAWIGIADYEKKRVVVAAGSGRMKKYFRNIKISINPKDAEGKGPTARAIRTGKVCICNDFFADRRMEPWQENAKKYGIQSSAAVPIKVGGNIIGTFNLYSDQKNFFTGEIKKLILEVGSDIGLCVEKLNAEEIRQKAEQKLRESEQHLQSIFNNIPVATAEVDFSQIKNFIDKLEKKTGIDIRTYLAENRDILKSLKSSVRFFNVNKQMFELFNTNDTEKLIELFLDSLITQEIVELLYKDQKIEHVETKIKIADGNEKNVIVNLGVLPGRKKDWSRLIVSIMDITDRVYMEKNLMATLARFRGLFETSSAGMGILDLEGRPIALNNRICEMLGYSRQELMGMILANVVHPDQISSLMATYEKLKKGEITHYETERMYVRKDGKIVWAYVAAQRIFDPVLAKDCITAVAIDMTEKKLYLQQLERIQNILQSCDNCNEIFARATDEKPMLFSICNEMTKGAKLGFTIVILRNDSGIEIAAYPDEGFEFLFELKELYLEKLITCPSTEGLFEKKRIVLNDVEQSNYSDDWKKIVLKYGYNSVLALPIVVEGNPIGCMTIFSKEKNRFVDEKENSIITNICEDIGYCVTMLRARKEINSSMEQLEKSYQQLQKTIEGISLSIAKIIETRDPYTVGHQSRVANLAVAIAREMKLSEYSVQGIYFAGILHDIGKVSVPVEILVKPTRLTDDEFNIIKLHSIYGYEILSKIPFPWDIAKIVLQHHERINGSGYPEGIAEKDILQEAKIIAVADVVEAMAFDRPYRTGFGIEFALNEIEQKKGILFDPDVVDICIKLFREQRFSFD
ncbi:MAG: PAS domain S-box protein [bacterium]|nr:PAS domain S-box protein [bacterium]